MALPISMFTKGVLITTPPLIYIFVGDIPMNSLVGDVASSASQESNMNSDDPSALPQGDSINSDVLPPAPASPPDNNALPPIDPAVDNEIAKESEPGVPAAEPVADNVAKEKEPGVTTIDPEVDSGDVKDTNHKVSEGVSQKSPIVSKDVSEDTNPGVSKEGPKEDGHSNVVDESTGDIDPSTDELSDVDDETDDDESTGDPGKNKEINEKLKDAGIDNSCFLPNLKTVGKCELDREQMLKINFPQKDEDDNDLEISGLEDGEKVTLTIESGYSEDDFPKGGLRLIFNNPNSSEVVITGEGDSDASLLPNIDHDYMFSNTQENWLDKTWKSLQKIGAKVGLNINNSVDDDCVAGKELNKKINVWKNKKEYVIGAESTSPENCLMKSTENNQNHLEGFILTVRDNKDITLTGGNGPSEGKRIDTLKKNVSYSIGPKRVGGKKV